MRVSDLLDMAGIGDGARSVTFTSVTGYYRRASLEEAENYILATHVGDEPLTHGHGAPLRLVAAGRRGFEWVKWIDRVTVNDTPKWLPAAVASPVGDLCVTSDLPGSWGFKGILPIRVLPHPNPLPLRVRGSFAQGLRWESGELAKVSIDPGALRGSGVLAGFLGDEDHPA